MGAGGAAGKVGKNRPATSPHPTGMKIVAAVCPSGSDRYEAARLKSYTESKAIEKVRQTIDSRFVL